MEGGRGMRTGIVETRGEEITPVSHTLFHPHQGNGVFSYQ